MKESLVAILKKRDEPVFVLIFKIKNVILCEWDFCLHVCLCTMCVYMAMEARRGRQISKNWSYRQLRAAMSIKELLKILNYKVSSRSA